MKRTWIAIAAISALTIVTTSAQGVFSNSNRDINRGVDAPVYASDGATPLDSQYVAQVWAGSSVDNMGPISGAAPFRDGNGAGYWNAPIAERTDGIAVPGVAAGEVASVQIVVWAASHGSLESAIAAGGANSWWASDTFSAVTGSPASAGPPAVPAAPTALVGLASVTMNATPSFTALSSLESMPANLAAIISANAVIPEPATIVLGMIGALALGVRLRGRRSS